MTYDEIESRIGNAFWRKNPFEHPPTQEEWSRLERQFGCTFPPEFHSLQDLMSEYTFEGGYLLITPRPNEDDIETVCKAEKETGRNWPDDLIPFYDVGNGDYVCLKASECPASAVYFIYHENDTVERIHENLAAWIKDSDWFP